jgi:3-oxoacyl-[acyl-carrier protein] reductase
MEAVKFDDYLTTETLAGHWQDRRPHMSELTGKVAIVTGASKGIGAAIAKGLAAAGASVVVNYASSREGADRVVAEIAARLARPSR